MVHRTTVAILLALAAVSVAVAQTSSSTQPAEGASIVKNNLQVTGTVITSEANRLTVKGDNGQQMVFIVTDTTVVPGQFHPGDRVTAEYVTLAGTGPVASKIVMVPAVETKTVTTWTEPASETKVTATVTPPVAEAKVTATVAETYPAAPTAKASVTTTTTVAPVSAKPYVADDETKVAALPATASSLPLVALLGLFAAGGAIAVNRFRHS